MKDSGNMATRSLTLLFILASSTSLTGCSTASNVAGGVYDTVMWAPRKIGSLFTVKNEQDTALGPRRRPSENPQNSGMPQAMQAPQSAENMPMPLMPQAPEQGGNFAPQMGSTNQGMMPQASPSGNYPSVNPFGNTSAMPQAASGGVGGAYPSMPPMPPMPQSGQPMSNLQPPEMGDSTGGQSAEAAWGGGGGAPQKKSWSLPFIGKYKMESTYEPLSAEFVVSQEELRDEEYVEPNGTISTKSSRKASMFPLEQYAPKADADTQKIETAQRKPYPKLGRVPENPNLNDSEKAAAELDNMVKEAEGLESKKAVIHNIPVPNNAAPAVNTQPDIKIPEAPIKSPEIKALPPQGINNIENLGSLAATVPLNKPASKESPIVAGEALSHDANVISELPKADSDNKQQSAEKDKQTPGFFAKLFGKSESSRKITRKSAPPVIDNAQKIEEPVFEQALPPVNIPDNIAPLPGYNQQNTVRPLPEVVINAGDGYSVKKYDTNNGSLLPKSRYTDRRKVPQTD